MKDVRGNAWEIMLDAADAGELVCAIPRDGQLFMYHGIPGRKSLYHALHPSENYRIAAAIALVWLVNQRIDEALA